MPGPIVFPERKEINVITISDDDTGMSSRSLVKTENDIIVREPDDDARDNEKATNMPEIDSLIRGQLLAKLPSIFVRDLIDGHECQCTTCQPEFAKFLSAPQGSIVCFSNDKSEDHNAPESRLECNQVGARNTQAAPR